MTGNRPVQEDLNNFLERETLALAVMGALSRNHTYSCQDDRKKEEFRGALRGCLNSLLEEYRAEEGVSEDRHVANIKALSSGMSERYGGILKGGKFRIGAAQKALNLYLKYAWAREIIPEPPHCPIDSTVLEKIEKCPKSVRCPICRCVTWTKMRTAEQYVHFIKKARKKADAKGQSLARWELGFFNAAKSDEGGPNGPNVHMWTSGRT